MGYPQVVRDKHKQVPIFLPPTHTLLASSGSWVALKIGGIRNPAPVPCPPPTPMGLTQHSLALCKAELKV